MDPMGRAIADYHKTKKASKLRVFSPMFEEDEIPLTTLFRSYDSMPKIERKALDGELLRWLDEEPHECDDQLQRRLPSVQFLY